MKDSKGIIHTTDLSSFFYERLNTINLKSLCPLPEEVIFYSSFVLNRYSKSSNFFEVSDGKVRNKILGLKFLENANCSIEEQKRIYKDIADTSLVLLGFFDQSIKTKIIDINYYKNIGMMAYSKIHALDEKFMDIPHFYKMMSTCFESLTTVIKLSKQEHSLFELNKIEKMSLGIDPSSSKLIS